MDRHFQTLIQKQWESKRFLCVGLDPDLERLPTSLKTQNNPEALLAFNTSIIDATRDLVCAFKPNSAFYEAHGTDGWRVLKETISYCHSVAPDVPVILDAKRADIGNTNEGYVEAIFDYLNADAVTVHPYLGGDAIRPFLDRREKGIFLLCRTSNHGAEEFQDMLVDGRPLHQVVAEHVHATWNTEGNCGLVVGATRAESIGAVRSLVGDMPILIPGVGAQGGDVAASVRAGKNSRGDGIIINSSRSILYASRGEDFADAARRSAQQLHDAINDAL